jgi:hypothetical protein
VSTDAVRLVDAITASMPDVDPGEYLYDLFDGGFLQVHTWIVKKNRWGYREANVYSLPDGTFAAIEAEVGATEKQEPQPDATAYVVEPYEKTVTRYRKRDSAPSSLVEGKTTTEAGR